MRFQTISEARWILAILFVLLLMSLLFSGWIALIFLLLIAYTFYFFRDPERESPADPKAIVAAADGVVADIIEIDEPDLLKTKTRRVGIFLTDRCNFACEMCAVIGARDQHSGELPFASVERVYRECSRYGPVIDLIAEARDEILLVSSGGVTIRTPVRDISSQGRDATGVRVMNLDEGQSVAAVAPVLQSEDDTAG